MSDKETESEKLRECANLQLQLEDVRCKIEMSKLKDYCIAAEAKLKRTHERNIQEICENYEKASVILLEDKIKDLNSEVRDALETIKNANI